MKKYDVVHFSGRPGIVLGLVYHIKLIITPSAQRNSIHSQVLD